MPDYLLGLMTLPAALGAIAAVYGLYRGAGWLIDKSPIRTLKLKDRPDYVANAASAVASCPRVFALRVSSYMSVVVGVGVNDQDRAEKVRRAVRRELVPPVEMPQVKRRKTGTEDA